MITFNEALQRAQHQDITGHFWQALVINGMSVLLFVSILWHTWPSTWLAVGVGLIVVVDTFLLVRTDLWRPRERSLESVRHALKIFTLTALTSGTAWFILATLCFNVAATEPGGTPLLVLLCGLIFSVSAGAIVNFGKFPPRLYAFIVPANLAGIVQLFRVDKPAMVFVGITFVAFLVGISISGRRFYRTYHDLVETRFRNEKLLDAYREQKDIAEQSSRAKTRFLAAASHDLRQPIHAIGLLADTLEVQAQTPDLKVLSQSIGESVSDLTSLLEVILDISRINAGLINADEKPVAVGKILGNLHKRFARQALDKQLDFRVRYSGARVLVDQALLERILGNLVSNAIKYTEDGGILIGVRNYSGNSLRIDIWDTGIGIPEDALNEIFLEYYQVGNLARASTEGLGLGLSIVKGLCTTLGYELLLKSRWQRGSVFSIVVPRAEPARLDDSPAAVAEPIDQPANVLLIDDDQRVLGATHQLLARRGYEVKIAEGEPEAVQIIERGFMPDVVFCDYRLADSVNGSDVLNGIRRRFGMHIRGVIITADTDPVRLQEASESGYLLRHKPLSALEMRRTLAQLFV